MPEKAWSWNDYKREHKEEPKKKPNVKPPKTDTAQLEREIAELRRAILILCNILVKEFDNRKEMGPLFDLLRPETRERARKVMQRRRNAAIEETEE